MTAEKIRELGSLSDEQVEAAKEFQKVRREARQTCFRQMVNGLLKFLIEKAPDDDKLVLTQMLAKWDTHISPKSSVPS